MFASRSLDGASEVLARHEGSQGNIWKKWDVEIPYRIDPYRIVIEALVGPHPGKGDIAIDDVVFHEHCRFVSFRFLFLIRVD